MTEADTYFRAFEPGDFLLNPARFLPNLFNFSFSMVAFFALAEVAATLAAPLSPLILSRGVLVCFFFVTLFLHSSKTASDASFVIEGLQDNQKCTNGAGNKYSTLHYQFQTSPSMGLAHLIDGGSSRFLFESSSSGNPCESAQSMRSARVRSLPPTKEVTFPGAPARAVRPLLWM